MNATETIDEVMISSDDDCIRISCSDSEMTSTDEDLPLSSYTNGKRKIKEPLKISMQKKPKNKSDKKKSGTNQNESSFVPTEPNAAMLVFEDFFSEDFYQFIADKSNLYIKNKGLKSVKRNTLFFKHSPELTPKHIKHFFAMLMYMGLVHKPAHMYYWKTGHLFQDSFTSKLLTRDKFFLILSALHFVDSTVTPPDDNPVYHLQPIIDYLRQKYRSNVIPGENVFLSEQSCNYKGVTTFKTPTKLGHARKWSINFLELRESKTGYCFDFDVFISQKRDKADVNSTHYLAMSIMEQHLNRRYHLFTNEQYTSAKLVKDLLQHNTICTGVCKQVRSGLPLCFIGQKLENNDVIYHEKGQLKAVKWKEQGEDVIVLSTSTNNSWDELKRGGQGVQRLQRRPQVVIDAANNCVIPCRKDIEYMCEGTSFRCFDWWKKAFYQIFSLAVVNSHVAFNIKQRARSRQTLPFPEYVSKIIHCLAADQISVSISRAIPQSCRFQGRHFPNYVTKNDAKTPGKGFCEVCHAREKFKANLEKRKIKRGLRTRCWCSKCRVFLCPFPCFKVYHTLQNYETPLECNGVKSEPHSDSEVC